MVTVVLEGDLCSGHGKFPPRPSLLAVNQKFKINGKAALCVGDKFETHCSSSSCHDGTVITGNSKFTIGGKAVAVTGSQLDCGSTIPEGSSNLTIG